MVHVLRTVKCLPLDSVLVLVLGPQDQESNYDKGKVRRDDRNIKEKEIN